MKHTLHVTTRRDLTTLQEMLAVFQQNDVSLDSATVTFSHPDSATVTFSFSTEEEKVNLLKSDLSTFGRVNELTSEKLLVLLS
ncbi:MAG: hypothetical protein ACFFCD_12710 [Promethearchaeota archaeon]